MNTLMQMCRLFRKAGITEAVLLLDRRDIDAVDFDAEDYITVSANVKSANPDVLSFTHAGATIHVIEKPRAGGIRQFLCSGENETKK